MNGLTVDINKTKAASLENVRPELSATIRPAKQLTMPTTDDINSRRFNSVLKSGFVTDEDVAPAFDINTLFWYNNPGKNV
jgi:hypothetical protein